MRHRLRCLLIDRVSKPPQSLDELGVSLELWDQLNSDQPTIEAKFQPLYDQFSILEKYEVAISDDVNGMLNEVSNEWVVFQQTLIDADVMLKKHKVSFTLCRNYSQFFCFFGFFLTGEIPYRTSRTVR